MRSFTWSRIARLLQSSISKSRNIHYNPSLFALISDKQRSPFAKIRFCYTAYFGYTNRHWYGNTRIRFTVPLRNTNYDNYSCWVVWADSGSHWDEAQGILVDHRIVPITIPWVWIYIETKMLADRVRIENSKNQPLRLESTAYLMDCTELPTWLNIRRMALSIVGSSSRTMDSSEVKDVSKVNE